MYMLQFPLVLHQQPFIRAIGPMEFSCPVIQLLFLNSFFVVVFKTLIG